MKKIYMIPLIASLCVFLSIQAFADVQEILRAEKSNSQIYINGEKKDFKNAPVTINGTTYIPLRELSNNLGLDVKWDETSKKIELDSKQTAASKTLDDDDLLLFRKDGLYGYMDKEENVIIKPQFYHANKFCEGLAAVDNSSAPGGCGYINTKGEFIISCQSNWWSASNFKNGIALIEVAEHTDEYTYMYIDKTGKQLFNKTYDYTDGFNEGYASILTKGTFAPLPNGGNEKKYSYINDKGERATEKEFDHTNDFLEGFAVVEDSGKYGIIDNKFNTIVDCKYDNILDFSNGLAGVYDKGKWGFVNTKGDIVVNGKFDDVHSFCQGLAGVCENGKWGFINSKGDIVVNCKFDDVHSFCQGLAGICENGKWGFIDTKGELIIPAKYSYARSFSEGLAVVQVNNKYGAINSKGEVVVKPKYDKLNDCENGLLYADGNIFVTKNGEEIKPK